MGPYKKDDHQIEVERVITSTTAGQLSIKKGDIDHVYFRFTVLVQPICSYASCIKLKSIHLFTENVQRLAFETMGNVDAESTEVEKCIIYGMMQIEEEIMSCRKCDVPGKYINFIMYHLLRQWRNKCVSRCVIFVTTRIIDSVLFLKDIT